MSIFGKIIEEIIPLSRKQNIVLLVIIASFFQFVLFYTPALADEAVNKADAQTVSSDLVIIDSVSKDGVMNNDAAELTKPMTLSTDEEFATSSPKSTTTDRISDKKAASSTEKVVRTSSHVITAYNSEAAQTDDSPCTTATGFNVCEHGIEDTIAANFLKFGTKVKIPELFGNRVFVVRDRMNAKHASRVDIWMKNKKDALKFGVKVAKIQVVE